MTHKESVLRRAAIADAVRDTQSVGEVAKSFGVSVQTVRSAAEERGVTVPRAVISVSYPRKHPLAASAFQNKVMDLVKSGKTCRAVGVNFGVSPQRVSQICAAHGVKLPRRVRLGVDHDAVLAMHRNGKSPEEIAKKLKIGTHTVGNVLRIHGVLSHRPMSDEKWLLAAALLGEGKKTRNEIADLSGVGAANLGLVIRRLHKSGFTPRYPGQNSRSLRGLEIVKEVGR